MRKSDSLKFPIAITARNHQWTRRDDAMLHLAHARQVAYSSRRLNAVAEPGVSNIVYKIVAETEWRDAQRSGSYSGSADDHRDGFIHLSFADQIEATAARHFAHRVGLLLVAFQADRLGDALRMEPSRGGALFPHLYADLPASAALWERPMTVGEDGIPRAAGGSL